MIDECNLGVSKTHLHTDLAVNKMIEDGRGSKRILHDRVDSPSKKQNNFQTLLKFWGGPGGVAKSNKPEQTYMNTTHPASVMIGTQNKNYFGIDSVDFDETAKSENRVDPTHGGVQQI